MRSQKEVLKGNIAAIEAVFEWERGKVLSEEQVQCVMGYTGFGYCKAVLMDPMDDRQWESASQQDKELRGLVNKLHAVLQDELSAKEYLRCIDSIKASVLTQYWTPTIIPDTFHKVLNEYNPNIHSVMDPSCGAGVFALSAMNHLLNLERVIIYEKDILTSKVLECIMMEAVKSPGNCTVYNKGFEESDIREDGKYDIVATNPPYGAYGVYDEHCPDKNYSAKVHNYFVWKGIQKLNDGGLLCYLITNAFLDTPSNKSARKYLYSNADHISVICMPDNLMKESANTEAPSHLIIARRRYGKTEADMSGEEIELIHSDYTQVQGGKVAENAYIHANRADITIGATKSGKNQYGKPSIETWWDGDINDIQYGLEQLLRRDMNQRYGSKLPTLSETFQEIADIMGPYIETNESPLDDEPGTCSGCGVGMFGSEPFCYRCKEQGRVLSPPDEDSVPWEDKMDTVYLEEDTAPNLSGIFSHNGWTEEQLQEQHARLVKKGLADEEPIADNNKVLQLSNIQSSTPLKPGTIISVKTGEQNNLFESKMELRVIESIDGDNVTTVPIELKKREESILKDYVEIRECYHQLNQEEK